MSLQPIGNPGIPAKCSHRPFPVATLLLRFCDLPEEYIHPLSELGSPNNLLRRYCINPCSNPIQGKRNLKSAADSLCSVQPLFELSLYKGLLLVREYF